MSALQAVNVRVETVCQLVDCQRHTRAHIDRIFSLPAITRIRLRTEAVRDVGEASPIDLFQKAVGSGTASPFWAFHGFAISTALLWL